MNISFLKNIYQKVLHRKAFSLIELSIVIVILSILISGALSIATSNVNSKKIKNTDKQINQIYEALKVYLAKNSALPCPASILEIKATSSTYGQSVGSEGSCSGTGTYTNGSGYTNLVYGMVPVATLGLSADMAEDAFGSKIAYIVDENFTDHNVLFSNNGSIIIKEDAAGDDQIDTESAVFTIISYGPNKYGAFPTNSATQNSSSTGSHEPDNYIIPIDASSAYFHNGQFYYKSNNDEVFDDIIFYKTRDQLVTDSGTFNLVPCSSETGSRDCGGGAVSYTWPQGKYNQVVSPTSGTCPSGYAETVAAPTRRCGVLGKWESSCTDPCTYSATTVTSPCTITNGTGTGSTSTSVSGPNTTYTHTFTVGTSTLTCSSALTVKYLVVGGGGGGGGYKSGCGGGGGGGGGGAVVANNSYSLAAGSYAITVGAAGTAGGAGTGGTGNGGSGGSSSFGAIATAAGGAGGVQATKDKSTCPAGGTWQSGSGVGGSSGNSNAGGSAGNNGKNQDNAGGGGAGAGAGGTAGATGSFTAGAGGAGITDSYITGLVYGGGGGGCGGGAEAEGTRGAGGNGGGGIGGGGDNSPSTGEKYSPAKGTDGRGGGGGGGGKGKSGGAAAGGAAGGYGTVIVSYTISS
ncbi:MAG: prepilin-type N-terminal cleavage/methylation domain-containing protein [Rickettsiales bacterium]|nr:prepilin-type N-terminal cleavage/methylation domain-containing protein [Rickettsiales bacterium]